MIIKRILLVSCEGFGNGGVQSVIMSITSNLCKDYAFDALLFTSEVRYHEERFLSLGGNIYRIPNYEGKNRFRKRLDYYIKGGHIYKEALKLFKKVKYDAVHCNNGYEAAYVLKAAKKAGVKVRISHTHVISEKAHILYNTTNAHRAKMIEKYATAKIACSNESGVSFFKDPNDVHIIGNSFNETKFDITKYQKDDEKAFDLLQIGSYSDNKNQLFSLEVVNIIKREYPDVRLMLVGFDIDNFEKKIKNRINLLGLCDNVELLPSDADTPCILSKSVGFLLPSKNEGFGIVLVEAQAMNVQCYASDGITKAADAGGVVYLPLSDANVWAEKIIDDYKNQKYKSNDFDVSQFRTSAIMQKYKDIYEGRP